MKQLSGGNADLSPTPNLSLGCFCPVGSWDSNLSVEPCRSKVTMTTTAAASGLVLVETACFSKAEKPRGGGGGGVSRAVGGVTTPFFPSTATAGSASASYCLISLTFALSAAAAAACALS